MEYYSQNDKEHLLGKLDARIKIVIAIALLGMVLSYRGLLFPIATASLCLLLCIFINVPLRVFLLRFSQPLFIAVMVLLLKLFLSGKETLFSIEIMGLNIIGHSDGLMEGVMIGSRIVGAVAIVALLGFSTPFTEFMAALSWFRVPKSFIEILMLAYRYIFVLTDDAHVIYNAQKNRLGYATMRRSLHSFGVLAGSLTLKAFDHSQRTTVAMVQRGYDGNMPLLKQKPFRWRELAVSFGFVVGMGCLWRL